VPERPDLYATAGEAGAGAGDDWTGTESPPTTDSGQGPTEGPPPNATGTAGSPAPAGPTAVRSPGFGAVAVLLAAVLLLGSVLWVVRRP
jgi:hypothetical protein